MSASKTHAKHPIAIQTGFSALTRPTFGPGMLLQADDLELMGTHARDVNRLLFRHLFGCGVVCGLTVAAYETDGKLCVTVAPGLALNCLGDPVHVSCAQMLCTEKDCAVALPAVLWVILRGTTKHCAPREALCADGDDDDAPRVHTRERHGFEIRVVDELPKDICRVVNADADASTRSCKDAACQDCCSEYVLLAGIARISKDDDSGIVWLADHAVRRFLRPCRTEDPQFPCDKEAVEAVKAESKKSRKAAGKS